MFLITFLNYAMAHFSRKCYTNVKTDLMASGVDKIILSQMDTAFMFTYAIGSFISGRLGPGRHLPAERLTGKKLDKRASVWPC